MVAFYNAADQELYKDYQFVPQEKYRTGFTAPVQGGGQDASTPSFGIPNTNVFTNSGGDNNFSGSTSNLGGQFQRAVDARQARLNDTSLNKNFLGFPSYRQGVTGADAGEYVGNNMDIPTQETFMGKVQNYLEPQSADEIMEDGYQEPRFQPGIIGTMLGKIDRYRNLPQANQAFISSRMGYTGPTIFGENNSGLSKNPYGINTRSLFGDYASYVGKKSGELKEQLDNSKQAHIDKYGSLDAVNKFGNTWAKHNKLKIEKSGFYDDEEKDFQGLKDKQYQDRINKFVSNYKKPGVKGMFEKVYDGNNIHNDPPGTPPNDGGGGGGDGTFGIGSDGQKSYSNPGDSFGTNATTGGPVSNKTGRGRTDYMKGGRAGYFFGGRVNFKDGGLTSIL